MKKISVIIYCHNAASYIDRCVASVTAQTTGIEKLELICVDDASTDDTWECLQRWEQRFPQYILLIRQEIEAGLGIARNIGLQYATADWITFVGAEDWLEPDCFEQLYGAAIQYDCDVVSCGWVEDFLKEVSYLDEGNKEEGKDQYFLADTPEKKKEQLRERILGEEVWGKIIRRELLLKQQMFFTEDIVNGEKSWMLWLHLYADHVYISGRKFYHHFSEARAEGECKGQKLRIVQFYSGTESFHYFTDRLTEELQKRGHEVFVCDLNDVACKTEHSYDYLNRFLAKRVDVVICFDGIGTREEQFIQHWDIHQAVVLDILMDPPFRFHPTLENHPRKYVLFCCDQEHVAYVKKYFPKEVPNVAFMPHVGSLIEEDGRVIPYKERKYDILFSASYLHPQTQMDKVKELFPNRPEMWGFYQQMFENLVLDSSMTIERAVLRTLQQFDITVSDETLKMLLNRSVYVDFAIRMYQRGRVVTALAESGLNLYLLGPGWENHPASQCTNVHRLDTLVPYRETLVYMADARINLNVMPWFKSGTHDRIFNTLLQRSLPLTDSSSWITDNFTDGVDIALYDLEHLDRLPGIVHQLLTDSVRTESIIQRGYEKVRQNFTWSNCTDWLLNAVDQVRKGDCLGKFLD